VLGRACSREECRIQNGIGAHKGRAGQEVYGKTVWRHLGGGLSCSSDISWAGSFCPKLIQVEFTSWVVSVSHLVHVESYSQASHSQTTGDS